MPEKINVIAIAGSLRKGSYNKKLLSIAVRIATAQGAKVETIDLKKPFIELYDGDVEEKGFPQSVQILRKKILQADCILIASPEYNYSVTGALKNAIDWASREPNALDGKIIAIMGASNGGFGTVRGQIHLRQILAGLNAWVVPTPQVHLALAQNAFDEKSNNLKDARLQERLENLVKRCLETTRKLSKKD